MAISNRLKHNHNEEQKQAQDDAPQFERVQWTKEPGLRKLYFYCIILCVASATTGYDGSYFNAVQNFNSWLEAFDHPNGSTLGLLGALYQIGSLASIPLVPVLADNFGRKIPIAIGCLIMIAGGFVQGFATSMGAHPQHRGRLTAVYNCLWNVGAFICAWLSFGTNYLDNQWSWRIPAILQALPSFIQIAFIYWIPESPRYLIAKDRPEEALTILGRYHANGNIHDPTVQFEYREIRETIKIEMEAKANSSYLDFFRTKGNRYRFIILISLGIFSQWSGNAIISNYASSLYDAAGVHDSNSRLGLQGGQTILALIVSVSTAMTVDHFGRRALFLTATGGMFVVFIFWTLCSGLYSEYALPGSNYAMLVFVWLFQFAYAIAWSGLLVAYAIEILPYKLRAKGLMILNISIQAALTLNSYANPVAFAAFGEKGYWKLYLIYTCWIFLELCFVYFMYVETRGPTLEELAKVIDGNDAQVAHLNLEQIEKEAEIVATHEHANERNV
ncbi:hypothetical protein TruAng_003952 [Truncatella angustata]|nr:hypothetical protein TruAng_003952 [Truncatella angustata]